jgi:5-formyltetrahydrofolate cyclo-ligase
MRLHRYAPGNALVRNRFGIDEPSAEADIQSAFDAMLVPLLGVDSQGHRLGHGGGFYDRYLSDYRTLHGALPTLIGLAWEVQLLDALAPDPWDIPLNAVLTERRLILCR